MSRRALLTAAAAAVALLLPAAGSAVWTTNLVELDNGTCGANLQIGSDRNASSIARPTFFLRGDGGLSSYAMAIDGQPIGTFYSTGIGDRLRPGPGRARRRPTSADRDGARTARRLDADTARLLGRYGRSRAAHAAGALGVQGLGRAGRRDHEVPQRQRHRHRRSQHRRAALRERGHDLRRRERRRRGNWSVTTVASPTGTTRSPRLALDTAGNKSAQSEQTRVTVDSVLPRLRPLPRSRRPTAAGTWRRARRTATRRRRVYLDGGQIGTAPVGRMRSWELALPALAPGSHSVAVIAADAADNTSALSAPLTFTVDAPTRPRARPDPPAQARPPAPP